ncbi:MAG: hypothetical protein U1G07_19965 [Verrucomicrobiota bacterium]
MQRSRVRGRSQAKGAVTLCVIRLLVVIAIIAILAALLAALW